MATLTHDALVAWIGDWVARELEMPIDQIDADRSLLEYSLSSVSATILVGDLEDHLDLELSPTLVWDYPTVNGLASHLRTLDAPSPATPTPSDTAEDDASLLARIDELSDEEVSALLARLEQ